jgi:hypothetical protein
MSKEGTSKLVAIGRGALSALGLKRRPEPIPVVAILAGLVIAVGAVFPLVPFARRALGRFTTLRVKPLPGETSLEKTPTNGASGHAPELDDVGRAENEGM